jgi:sugar/nucleoside kinase (ribokinase family)
MSYWVGITSNSRRPDYYVRQLRDWKGSIEISTLDPKSLAMYAGYCAWILARAHARSGDRVAIAAYLGGKDAFDQAIADFSAASPTRTNATLLVLRMPQLPGRSRWNEDFKRAASPEPPTSVSVPQCVDAAV